MIVHLMQPTGWTAETVSMDGAVYIRAKSRTSSLPWQYVLSSDEAMQLAQQLEEAALEARRWHQTPERERRPPVAAAAPYEGPA